MQTVSRIWQAMPPKIRKTIIACAVAIIVAASNFVVNWLNALGDAAGGV